MKERGLKIVTYVTQKSPNSIVDYSFHIYDKIEREWYFKTNENTQLIIGGIPNSAQEIWGPSADSCLCFWFKVRTQECDASQMIWCWELNMGQQHAPKPLHHLSSTLLHF